MCCVDGVSGLGGPLHVLGPVTVTLAGLVCDSVKTFFEKRRPLIQGVFLLWTICYTLAAMIKGRGVDSERFEGRAAHGPSLGKAAAERGKWEVSARELPYPIRCYLPENRTYGARLRARAAYPLPPWHATHPVTHQDPTDRRPGESPPKSQACGYDEPAEAGPAAFPSAFHPEPASVRRVPARWLVPRTRIGKPASYSSKRCLRSTASASPINLPHFGFLAAAFSAREVWSLRVSWEDIERVWAGC